LLGKRERERERNSNDVGFIEERSDNLKILNEKIKRVE